MGTVDDEPFLAGVRLRYSMDDARAESVLAHEAIPLEIVLFMAPSSRAACARSTRPAPNDGQHLGLVHRDVGSRNVLIGFDGRMPHRSGPGDRSSRDGG